MITSKYFFIGGCYIWYQSPGMDSGTIMEINVCGIILGWFVQDKVGGQISFQ